MATISQSACSSSPVAVNTSIQPFGFVLALSKSGVITHASANTTAFIGKAPAVIIGELLERVFNRGSSERIRAAFVNPDETALPVASTDGREWHASLVQTDDGYLMEVEAVESVSLQYAARRLASTVATHALDDMSLPGFLQQQVELAMESLQADRAMVLRFTEQDTIDVVAESVVDDLPPYLDLTYPGTDIPSFARARYLETPLRVIQDASGVEIPMIPEGPLDIARLHLRGVPAIHRAYQQAMGVSASASVALIVDGLLWGLLAVHSRKPMPLGPSMRESLRMCSHLWSAGLARALRFDIDTRHATCLRAANNIRDNINGGPASAIEASSEELLDAFAADALVLFDDHGNALVNTTACTDQSLARLYTYAESSTSRQPYASDSMAALGTDELGYCGMLSIRLWLKQHVLVCLLRSPAPPVRWGSRREKSFTETENGDLVMAADTFTVISQERPDQSIPWSDAEIDAAVRLRGQTIAAAHESVDGTLSLALEFEQSSREFLSHIAHELRAPLGPIVGWSEFLLTPRPKDATMMQNGLGAIARNGALLLRLLENIRGAVLDANETRLSPKPAALGPLLSSACEVVMSRYPKKGIYIEVDDQCGEQVMMLDADRFLQALWNVLGNAAKYSPSGGRISLSTSRNAENDIEITISDCGPGLGPGNVSRLFSKFHQGAAGKRMQSGLGLGLAITHQVLDLHGGKIEAHNNANGGASFILTLPSEVCLDEPVTSEEDEIADINGARIAIFGSGDDTLLPLENLLESAGIQVSYHADADAETSPNLGPSDLAIIDCSTTPRWSKTLAEVEKRFPSLAIVLLRADAHDNTPANHHTVHKFAPVPVLYSTLLRALGGR